MRAAQSVEISRSKIPGAAPVFRSVGNQLMIKPRLRIDAECAYQRNVHWNLASFPVHISRTTRGATEQREGITNLNREPEARVYKSPGQRDSLSKSPSLISLYIEGIYSRRLIAAGDVKPGG